jgi:hypothetical protein
MREETEEDRGSKDKSKVKSKVKAKKHRRPSKWFSSFSYIYMLLSEMKVKGADIRSRVLAVQRYKSPKGTPSPRSPGK